MATENLRDFLARVELFSTLQPDVIDALVAAGATMTYRPASPIVEQGAMGGGFQLVVSGSASVLVNGEPVRALVEGDYIGEMSLFEEVPRSATVVAGEAGAKTFAISPLNFGGVLESNPKAARTLLAMLARRVREVEARGATR